MEEDKKTVTKKKDVQRTGSQFMIGKQWVFIKDGLDDFRDGLPPSSDSDLIVHVGYNFYTLLEKWLKTM